MRIRSILLLVSTTAVLASSTVAAAFAAAPAAARSGQLTRASIDQASVELSVRLAAGKADPVRDARAAADEGDFRLIYIVVGRGRSSSAPGVSCNTPWRSAGPARASAGWGDTFDDSPAQHAFDQFVAYATSYNRAVVDHPLYLPADICAPETSPKNRISSSPYSEISHPARVLKRTPLTLHEAARRGSASQLRALLKSTAVDELDDFGMTALAWAAAYGRVDMVRLLLKAGAQPTPTSEEGYVTTPVMAATSQGRLDILHLLQRPTSLPRAYVEAALWSGDLATISEVLNSPHEPPDLRTAFSVGGSPSLELATLLIAHEGSPAVQAILMEGARKGRPDLIRLAIRHGADVNANDMERTTPLLAALDSYDPNNQPVIEALLAAGADVNAPPHPGGGWGTAFWRAYDHVRFGQPKGLEIFRAVARAGGDASISFLPDVLPAWTVAFPQRGDFNHVDLPSDEVLGILMKAGLDLNAPHDERCLLDAVETSAGRDSEPAQTLRRFGARGREPNGTCSAKP